MKFFKFVTLLSLSSAFIFNAAFAAEPNTKGKVQTTQQTKQKTKNTQEGALSQFKKSIDIHFEERDIVVDDDNQAYVLVKYSVENKSNKPIKSLYWIAAYLYDQQMIYSHDVPLNFAQPMAPKTKITVNLRIPFNQIPEQYRSLFTHLQEPIQVYSVARNLTFADGQQINVAN
ncbi:hypothetical protein [Aggregatibacter actinomycetemcomitans]|uniref:hypothetical protein n=1 Tax=Aggregatibacter actinomycetemcomitans TaxID=714 RepID=UPI001E529CE9|nr:hypothetical protein [Aggregatibacter actinomycetemcomitans]